MDVQETRKFSCFKTLAILIAACVQFPVAASADPYGIVCSTTGSLGQSQYIIHVNDPLIPNITSARVRMTAPSFGAMSVLGISDIRFAASVEHGVPGFPNAILTIIINRDTGIAQFFLTKTPVHDPLSLFWIINDNILGKDQGVCEKFISKF